MSSEPLVILSSPGNIHNYSSSVVVGRSFKANQVLLGADAQVSAALSLFNRAKIKAFYTPCPEIFSSSLSLDALRRAAKARRQETDGPIIHIRFGPLSSARLLKGADNVLFLSENHSRPVLALGTNVTSEGWLVPESFKRVFCYQINEQELYKPSGSPLKVEELSEYFTYSDILDFYPQTVVHHRTVEDIINAEGLYVQSILEFDPISWNQSSDKIGRALIMSLFNRSLLDSVSESKSDGLQKFKSIAIPVNLSDAGGCIFDLVKNFIRYDGFNMKSFRLVLFPYNEVLNPGAVENLVKEIMSVASQYGRTDFVNSRVFIGKITSLDIQDLFSELFPVSIVDGSDPESSWSSGRLKLLGCKVILLVDPDMQKIDENKDFQSSNPIMNVIHLDMEKRIRIDDRSGSRVYATKTASVNSTYGIFEMIKSIIDKMSVDLNNRDRPILHAPQINLREYVKKALLKFEYSYK